MIVGTVLVLVLGVYAYLHFRQGMTNAQIKQDITDLFAKKK